jgi:hypothetical protein
MSVAASSHIHSSVGSRSIVTVRVLGIDHHSWIGSRAETPFVESATTISRCSGAVSSPATSGIRTRVHSLARPVGAPVKPPSTNRHSTEGPYPHPSGTPSKYDVAPVAGTGGSSV